MADTPKRTTSTRKPASRKAIKTSRSRGAKESKLIACEVHRWTFLSNHAHVLVCLARDPEVLLREVAQSIGITERAVQKIVTDLEVEGLIKRHREGRRNRYELHLDRPLRHPIERHRRVSDLVRLILE